MNVLEAGLYALLVADTALVAELGAAKVYRHIAPPGTGRPYVVLSHAGGGPTNQTPSDTREHVYLVKGVSDEQQQSGDIDDLLLAALHQTEDLTVVGFTVMRVQAESNTQIAEVPTTGQPIYHNGHNYRFMLDDS